ncbi:MAG: ferredoxin [gamma proteobacterium endosymbiont of Lamellibrachia anaximandri]|nr:ferredoxin [gamma proteobacterium endosymbiont of Lamellibrachia anaximandri]
MTVVQTGEATPAMPSAIKDAEATKTILHTLRHFHLGNPSVRGQLEPLGDDFLPALMAPYRDASRLRYDYPLFLYPAEGGDEERRGAELAKPLSIFLTEATEAVAPGESGARILKDNLPRLEQALRLALQESQAPVPAKPLLSELSTKMVEQLGLDSDSTEKLRSDLHSLLESIPESGKFLAYGQHPALHLMIHVIRSQVIPRHAHFQQEVEAHIRGLKLLLAVERGKSAEAKAPAALEEAVGHASHMFDANALADVMDHSHGSIGMTTVRRERVEEALKTLESYHRESILVRFVHTDDLDETLLGDIPGFESVVSDNPSIRAKEIFDEQAARLAKVFAAARIAKLEIGDLYDESIHDPWFETFNWEAFSHDELLLVPAVIALETALRVAGEAMPDFSRLLNSGRPVQILVRVLGHANPGRDSDKNPFAHFRTELGYLGISHRQAFVSQTSAARHEHLLDQFSTALDATRTGLHLINVGLRPTGQDAGLNGWLVAGAALEGRVHPFFQINPSAGDSFADRVDFSGNPQPEMDWAVHEFSYRDENGEAVTIDQAFTFADYALLIPRLHGHFTPVPLICETDSLLPVADYLAMPEEESAQHIPYILALNSKGELRQLAVSRTLIQACRDRLNFWHALQEMAGVRSRYLEIGIAEAREEINSAAEARIETLTAEQAQKLDEARSEAAGEVMSRLTEVLLGMDFTSGAPRMPAAPAADTVAAPVESQAEAVAEAPAAPVEEEEDLGSEEPWIDSVLCTTCNDCLAINPQVFVYNDENQAYIADAGAGTYAQMVEAAEICPSNCIHPGKPINDSEAGLDELIERAAQYN